MFSKQVIITMTDARINLNSNIIRKTLRCLFLKRRFLFSSFFQSAYDAPNYYIAITAVDPDTRMLYAGLNDIFAINGDTGASTVIYAGEKELRFLVRGFGE